MPSFPAIHFPPAMISTKFAAGAFRLCSTGKATLRRHLFDYCRIDTPSYADPIQTEFCLI